MRIVNANVSWVTPEFIIDESYKLIEAAARTCYRSEKQIVEGSAEDITGKMMRLGHGAMLEHANLSIRFTCDRGVSHEIVRHRLASYAQESTRYCNYAADKFGHSVDFINLRPGILIEGRVKDKKTIVAILQEWREACKDAERHYFRMLELGASPQIARSVLNNSTRTSLVMTANLREWLHFLNLRSDAAAHPQMREVAWQVLELFMQKLPLVVEGLK